MIPSFFRLFFGFSLLAQVAGCSLLHSQSAGSSTERNMANPWALASTGHRTLRAWDDFRFPGKAPTRFAYAREEGREAMSVSAKSSASMWRQVLRIEPEDLGHVSFSWKVPALISRADMSVRELDDSPVRIVLAFDGDRRKLSAKDAMLSELARALTGEEMPYATMMYVWCNACPRGSVIVNTRTTRIRKLALESGPGRLNRWLDYERSIREDFEKLFGEPPGALISVALMTDTDNTASAAKAWYGPLNFVPPPPAPAAAVRPLP